MRIAIMGIQGSGKGVQGDRLASDLCVPRIVIGDVIRERARVDDEVGREIADQMGRGELVAEPVVVQALAVRLALRPEDGFVLDGFPRSGTQVGTLDAMLGRLGAQLDVAIHLEIDEQTARSRMADRLVCSVCNAPTSRRRVGTGDPCPLDSCVGTVVPRTDDQDSVAVDTRLAEFYALTVPVIDEYRQTGRLIEIEATRDEDAVYDEMRSRLAALAGSRP
jgi:adenylate kinase